MQGFRPFWARHGAARKTVRAQEPQRTGEQREGRTHDISTLEPQALWAVQVPFRVTGPLRIGTIFDTIPVAVPSGNYIVTYQGFPGPPGAYLLRLSFTPDDAPGFRILKRGGDITADQVLRRDAEPASPAGQ